jgi:hypothetical protein
MLKDGLLNMSSSMGVAIFDLHVATWNQIIMLAKKNLGQFLFLASKIFMKPFHVHEKKNWKLEKKRRK